ncbi:tricalbin-3 isoform X1 [Tanacetum coccineum]
MVYQDSSQILWVSSPPICPCNRRIESGFHSFRLGRRRKFTLVWACVVPTDGNKHPLNLKFVSSTKRGANDYVKNRISSELVEGDEAIPLGGNSNNFANFREDPIVDKLRTQLGVIHPMPSPPINRNIVGLFVFFFFVGVVFDKVWTSRKRNKSRDEGVPGMWPQVPMSFSLFLEKDLQRKVSVEWVNMVLGKLWKVYRGGLENWVIGLLQPVIDNLKKPEYVERVEIKQFSLGNEPLSVRNVERRTSRRVNDLHLMLYAVDMFPDLRVISVIFEHPYQIGLRYTGGARMLLMLSLKFGIIPIKVPVGIRDFDIDGELWVKLRLIPSEPWVGAVSWAFVSLPKIKFELSPFRLFNLMVAKLALKAFMRNSTISTSRCSKKLKSKTRGVSRVSSRKACSRESKSKSPEGDPAQTPKKELPAFMHTTLKVTRVRGWEIDENGKVLISGYINRSQFISRLQETSENIKVEHFQGGECSSRLSRKKEAPSIKNEGPSTNNANPPTNYANPPTLGYYQPQGYGGYYASRVRRGLEAIMIMSAFMVMDATMETLIRRGLARLSQKKLASDCITDTQDRLNSIDSKYKDFVGELSVTLVDARKLTYAFFGKSDPYVVLRLGDQVIRSKKNSQTTVIGAPGEPIWNQDFYMLVTNPRKQKLSIQVKDFLGLADTTVGSGEVDLGSLKDTVPTDKIVALRGGWGLFRKGYAGEILLRLTYKAYVEDEEDEKVKSVSKDIDASDDELSDMEQAAATYGTRVNESGTSKEAFMDVLASLLVSEEFQGIVASETANAKYATDVRSSESKETPLGAVSAPELEKSEDNSRGKRLSGMAAPIAIQQGRKELNVKSSHQEEMFVWRLELDKPYKHSALIIKDKYKSNAIEAIQAVENLRGAYSMTAKLTKEQREKGVICSVAGNHAQGVALETNTFSCDAVIVVGYTMFK